MEASLSAAGWSAAVSRIGSATSMLLSSGGVGCCRSPGATPLQLSKRHMMTTPLNALANLRDLGGLSTSAGAQTRSGVLYRSALPIAGDEAPVTVPIWPARTVIDLRSSKEQAVTEHPLLSETTNIYRVPLLSDEDVAEMNLLSKLDLVYSGIVSNAGKQLVQVLRLAATAPAPVLLHCAGGKDRTGIATAMLLSAAGVDAAHIAADYAATEQHMESVLARIRRTDPSFAHGKNMHDNDLARAAPETINRVLDRWDTYPGGIYSWLLDNGAEADAITQWVDRLVSAP
jgi:protein-tyrosine phosphatase